MSVLTKTIDNSKQRKNDKQGNSPRWVKTQRRIDHSMRRLFIVSAVLVSAVIFSIIIFVGYQGMQTFKDVSFSEIFFSTDWNPTSETNPSFGTLPFVYSTILLTVISVALAIPLALSGAVFLAKISPKWMREILRPAADLFVGIPSVVYGLIGLTVIVPFLADTFGGTGYGILPAAIILAVMILPTIMSVSEDALRSLPGRLEEASLALGATRFQTIWRVLLPAAKPGILTGVILGMGRAIGETMAVFMVIGNSPKIPHSLLDSTTVLTTAIVKGMANTFHGTAWNNSLYLMSFVLLILSLALILLIRVVAKRSELK
ncbi:phosphate ABC transporter permease subunit PstC [Gorillibacterium massiliense]|uniref:phosphate ABC transporter permease subunit PstC n=1 Tax=Gorillibacterium massiliense TaxID=1280390 RepID=UPI000593D6BF|nr:phosphate ABC transporter permease subunit PstC [Gorillibacterium massiliense]